MPGVRVTAAAPVRSCRVYLPSAIRVSWLGEAVEEESAVCGPYEAFCDFRVAFIVDLEAAVGHRPRPCSFNNPTSREDHERVGMDPVDDLDRDVTGSTVRGERLLEPGIDPQLGEAPGLRLRGVEHGDPAGIVGCRRDHHLHPDEESEGVDESEHLTPGDLLACIVALGQRRDRRCPADTAGIDDSASRPSLSRTSSRSRSQTRSHVPSRDQVT